MSLEMYREQILEHYKHPHNKGRLSDADTSVKDANPLCADEIEVFLKISNNKIQDVKFDGIGCAISTAATSLLTDHVKGMSLDDVKKVSRDDVFKLLGVPVSPARTKCALLSLKAIKSATYKYLGEKLDEKFG
ncbi:SUF system NifU family Fe-S cluster assembly protein [Candidatus Micrarchaeota archaeon]|nr:SUF system NifU family Fe-S cluster assembly protein [Candidatus Micrarchaeota archaeon]